MIKFFIVEKRGIGNDKLIGGDGIGTSQVIQGNAGDDWIEGGDYGGDY